jgi:hypothetical protein
MQMSCHAQGVEEAENAPHTRNFGGFSRLRTDWVRKARKLFAGCEKTNPFALR